jgi:hypothetical protein
MKKPFRNILFTALWLTVLNACEGDIDIELPPYPSQLVVHGYVSTGEFFKIAVGRTMSSTGIVTQSADSYITDALVILYEDGVKKDTMAYDSATQRYISTKVMAEAGKTYKVTVAASGFMAVDATAIAPSFVNTEQVKFQRNARVSSDGTVLDDITFRFHDPAIEQNYYFVEVNRPSPFASYNRFCIYTYEPSIVQSQAGFDPFQAGSCINNDEILFTDHNFNGLDKEITISGNSFSLTDVEYNNRIYRPYLKKYNVSADFFRYVKDGISLGLVDENPFVQPLTVSSNVHNGYGLFTVFSVVTDTLR